MNINKSSDNKSIRIGLTTENFAEILSNKRRNNIESFLYTNYSKSIEKQYDYNYSSHIPTVKDFHRSFKNEFKLLKAKRNDEINHFHTKNLQNVYSKKFELKNNNNLDENKILQKPNKNYNLSLDNKDNINYIHKEFRHDNKIPIIQNFDLKRKLYFNNTNDDNSIQKHDFSKSQTKFKTLNINDKLCYCKENLKNIDSDVKTIINNDEYHKSRACFFNNLKTLSLQADLETINNKPDFYNFYKIQEQHKQLNTNTDVESKDQKSQLSTNDLLNKKMIPSDRLKYQNNYTDGESEALVLLNNKFNDKDSISKKFAFPNMNKLKENTVNTYKDCNNTNEDNSNSSRKYNMIHLNNIKRNSRNFQPIEKRDNSINFVKNDSLLADNSASLNDLNPKTENNENSNLMINKDSKTKLMFKSFNNIKPKNFRELTTNETTTNLESINTDKNNVQKIIHPGLEEKFQSKKRLEKLNFYRNNHKNYNNETKHTNFNESDNTNNTYNQISVIKYLRNKNSSNMDLELQQGNYYNTTFFNNIQEDEVNLIEKNQNNNTRGFEALDTFHNQTYREKTNFIKSFLIKPIRKKTFENLTSNSSMGFNNNHYLSTDKNFYYKSSLKYPNVNGRDSIGAFVEKTKFTTKLNYLKSIQSDKKIKMDEEFNNKIEEVKMKIKDLEYFKKLFEDDFMETLENYTRFCVKQKERERQELNRIINEKNNSHHEILKLEKRKEKLIQQYTLFSEYKRFMICVKYRISYEEFGDFILKKGGTVEIKEEIKNIIKMNKLRNKHLAKLKKQIGSSIRRKTMFVNSRKIHDIEDPNSNNNISNNMLQNASNKSVYFQPLIEEMTSNNDNKRSNLKNKETKDENLDEKNLKKSGLNKHLVLFKNILKEENQAEDTLIPDISHKSSAKNLDENFPLLNSIFASSNDTNQKSISKSTKIQSKSVKNLIKVFTNNKFKTKNDTSQAISDFSSLLRSLKELDNGEQVSKQEKSPDKKIITLGSLFALKMTEKINNNNKANNNNNDIKSNLNSDHNSNLFNHYDRSLDFINGTYNQNEESKSTFLIKNSKGFKLINKFFNPLNKDVLEKQNLLSKMLKEYNTVNLNLFSNTTEFNEIFFEIQQRNIDLLNVYNKNQIVLKELHFKKKIYEKNNTEDINKTQFINKIEKTLSREKKRNEELKKILMINENKHDNLKIRKDVWERIQTLFNNLKYLKDKINDSFIIMKDLHENINIYESLQIFSKIEKSVDFLYSRLNFYKRTEKYRNLLNKLIKEIENEKKFKILRLEKEKHEENQRKFLESYLDKCIRSDIYSKKRKTGKIFQMPTKEIIADEIEEETNNKLYREFLENLAYYEE